MDESSHRHKYPFNAMTEAAKKALGLTDDRYRWVAFDTIATLPDGTRQIKVTIGIYLEVMKSGKRKGLTNFKKPLERHEVIVTDKDIDDAKDRFERETGKCCVCQGNKEEVAGWGKETGTRYRPCRRCGATGRAPIEAITPEATGDQP